MVIDDETSDNPDADFVDNRLAESEDEEPDPKAVGAEIDVEMDDVVEEVPESRDRPKSSMKKATTSRSSRRGVTPVTREMQGLRVNDEPLPLDFGPRQTRSRSKSNQRVTRSRSKSAQRKALPKSKSGRL